MAFGKHWEWRGFGEVAREVRAAIERLPRKFPDSQRVTDRYLFVPGRFMNVKLRESCLKFKRFIEARDGLECWLEDEDENHPFPIAPAVVVKLAPALGIDLAEARAEVGTPDELAALLLRGRSGVQVIAVEKERWQHEWTAPGADETADPVTVELAEIRAPQRIVSVGIEHSDPRAVAACRDALGLPAGLVAASYLDALRVWASGGKIG